MSFAFADDLGPEKTIELYDPRAGLKAILVVDNTAVGPSLGGVRMAPDVTAEECFRLARAMSFKNAVCGLAHGGGKSVILADPAMPGSAKEKLIRAFARAIAEIADYIPGPDMGTNERAMAWIHDEIGRAAGLPREIGGIPLDEIGATGYGLAVAAEVAENYSQMKIAGARLAVQGFGAVGIHAARFLAERGAVLVGVADSHGTIANPEGLDLDALVGLKSRGDSVSAYAGGTKGPPDAIISVGCDIWIPAARPDVITMTNVDRLNTLVVLEGANIPVEFEAERVLHERGVLVIPDFVANAGGVISAAVEHAGGTEAQAMAMIREKIAANTEDVLAEAKRNAIRPRDAAAAIAGARLKRAMSYRRI